MDSMTMPKDRSCFGSSSSSPSSTSIPTPLRILMTSSMLSVWQVVTFNPSTPP